MTGPQRFFPKTLRAKGSRLVDQGCGRAGGLHLCRNGCLCRVGSSWLLLSLFVCILFVFCEGPLCFVLCILFAIDICGWVCFLRTLLLLAGG